MLGRETGYRNWWAFIRKMHALTGEMKALNSAFISPVNACIFVWWRPTSFGIFRELWEEGWRCRYLKTTQRMGELHVQGIAIQILDQLPTSDVWVACCSCIIPRPKKRTRLEPLHVAHNPLTILSIWFDSVWPRNTWSGRTWWEIITGSSSFVLTQKVLL